MLYFLPPLKITSITVGLLCRIDGAMDAQLYRNILEGDLATLGWYSLFKGDTFSFNMITISSIPPDLPKKWLKNNRISVSSWTAQPPDSNPTEHLWNKMGHRLGKHPHQPTKQNSGEPYKIFGIALSCNSAKKLVLWLLDYLIFIRSREGTLSDKSQNHNQCNQNDKIVATSCMSQIWVSQVLSKLASHPSHHPIGGDPACRIIYQLYLYGYYMQRCMHFCENDWNIPIILGATLYISPC